MEERNYDPRGEGLGILLCGVVLSDFVFDLGFFFSFLFWGFSTEQRSVSLNSKSFHEIPPLSLLLWAPLLNFAHWTIMTLPNYTEFKSFFSHHSFDFAIATFVLK